MSTPHFVLVPLPNRHVLLAARLAKRVACSCEAQCAVGEHPSLSCFHCHEQDRAASERMSLLHLKAHDALICGIGGAMGLYRYNLYCPGRDQASSRSWN